MTTAASPWNVPNALTTARLALSLLVFVLTPLGWYAAALAVFIVAAATDWIDGYWARKFGQVTVLGRIFDPFVDKFLICGVFIVLAVEPGSGVAGWMALVVVGRELLVTALRGYMEQIGVDFSAKQSGKWKMVLQCLAVGACYVALLLLADDLAAARAAAPPATGASLVRIVALDEAALLPPWLYWTRAATLWGAIVLTIYSGVVYIVAAAKHILR